METDRRTSRPENLSGEPFNHIFYSKAPKWIYILLNLIKYSKNIYQGDVVSACLVSTHAK